ncbi:MAG: hypothetical protein HC822_17960 [Oscillochloris sp.]|nr:hypothetical protein [Oscillochloris sp.]
MNRYPALKLFLRRTTIALLALFIFVMLAANARIMPAGAAAAFETPPATPTAQPSDALPPEARAALDAFLAAEGAGLAASAADAPQSLSNSFTYVHLPTLDQARRTPGGAPPPTVTPTTRPTEEPTEEPEPETADVAVVLWADPSIRVVRGGTFSLDVRVRNHGEGRAEQVTIRVPYRRDQFTLLDGRFDRSKGDWVSNIGDNTITITFGSLSAGKERSGKLTFRAAANLPNDTILDLKARYGWSDAGDGANEVRSNWMPLLVGAGNANAAYVWAAVNPTSARAFGPFRFQSNRFLPGETVVAWMNTPWGVQPLALRDTADALGAVTMTYQDTKLPAGSYQMVLYGQRSKLTGVVSFTVVP